MTRLKVILFLAALAVGLTTVTAITPEPSATVTRKKVTPNRDKTLRHEQSQESNRPQVPSKQRISCAYDGEYLILGFVVPEGECEITLTEWYTNAEQTYVIDSTPLSAEIYVGELYESTLTITTAHGHTYIAELTADPDDE